MWAVLKIGQKSFSGATSLVVGEFRSGAEILHCQFWGEENSKGSVFQVQYVSPSSTASPASLLRMERSVGKVSGGGRAGGHPLVGPGGRRSRQRAISRQLLE